MSLSPGFFLFHWSIFHFGASTMLSWWLYFIVNSEVRRLIPPDLLFFLKISLAIQRFLWFHTNCDIICSSSVKNTYWCLIGIALNLYIALGSIVIFTILIHPIQEHGISICLCYLWFLSSVSYCFLHTGLMSPRVTLFLSILFILLQWLMGLLL